MATSPPSKSSPRLPDTQALSIIVVIAILGVLVADVAWVKQASGSLSMIEPAAVSGPVSPYHDGTYQATATYGTPVGVQPIKVRLTLKSGKITSVTATPQAEAPASQAYETAFVKGYHPLVIGQDINLLHLSKVSGASLTTKGFNRAIDQIRHQAQR